MSWDQWDVWWVAGMLIRWGNEKKRISLGLLMSDQLNLTVVRHMFGGKSKEICSRLWKKGVGVGQSVFSVSQSWYILLRHSLYHPLYLQPRRLVSLLSWLCLMCCSVIESQSQCCTVWLWSHIKCCSFILIKLIHPPSLLGLKAQEFFFFFFF